MYVLCYVHHVKLKSAVAKFGFCVATMFCVSFTIANFANADSIAAKSRNVGVFSGRCG